MLPDVVLELAERGHVSVEVAEATLAAIRPRYHVGVIEHSVVRLREVRQDAEDRSAGQGGDSAGGGAP